MESEFFVKICANYAGDGAWNPTIRRWVLMPGLGSPKVIQRSRRTSKDILEKTSADWITDDNNLVDWTFSNWTNWTFS